MPEIVSIENVCFSYKEKLVLDNINFSINTGDIIAILGHNGAGKTTLIKLIAGLEKIETGNINRSIKFEEIGYMNEELGFYPFINGKENLEILLSRNKIMKDDYYISEILKKINIEDDKKLVCNYSTGMKKKLGVIGTMISNPKLVLLDEPFSGIDPVSLKFITDYIQSKVTNNNAVVLVNHNLEITKKICNKFVILNKGKIVYSSKEDDFKNLERIYMQYSE